LAILKSVWRAWALALALMFGGAVAAQTVERSTGEASVQFPGPPERIEQTHSPDVTGWEQIAPTPADPGRVLAFDQRPLPWWTRWLFRQAPDLMMSEISDRIKAKLISEFDVSGGSDVDVEQVYVNGHPALRISTRRRDMAYTRKRSDGQPTLIGNRRHATMLILWTGETLVSVATTGNRPVAQDDPFLRSVTTRTVGVPGDPDEQYDRLCDWLWKLCGVLLVILVVALIALVYAIDKAIKRRRRKRLA
jgi:hypothetical protein